MAASLEETKEDWPLLPPGPLHFFREGAFKGFLLRSVLLIMEN
jgi:hypothetical protein